MHGGGGFAMEGCVQDSPGVSTAGAIAFCGTEVVGYSCRRHMGSRRRSQKALLLVHVASPSISALSHASRFDHTVLVAAPRPPKDDRLVTLPLFFCQ